MASTLLKDVIGNWQLFLLGLLLSVTTVTIQPPTAAAATTDNSTQAPTSNTTAASSSNTTQAPNSTATSNLTTSMSPVSSTTVASIVSTTQLMHMAASTGAVSTPNMSSVSSSSVMSSNMSANMGNTTEGGMNGTTSWKNSSMSTISCPSFKCNHSNCYSMYNSQNASMCPSDYNYCELKRHMDMCYIASCSASCSMSCVNASQSNCSVDCCNSTGCLNKTFASMMVTSTTSVMTTTTRTTTTSATTTTTTMTPTTTPAGNKCHTGTCSGATGTECFKDFKTQQVCSSSEKHCQMKKENDGSLVKWTAGCTTDCSGQSKCVDSSSQAPCNLECCVVNQTSCLKLDGKANLLSLATRGPRLHSELLTLVLFVFAITLML